MEGGLKIWLNNLIDDKTSLLGDRFFLDVMCPKNKSFCRISG